MAPETTINLHATSVAFGTSAIVLMGAAGTGKSTLALHLIELGAALISDDMTRVTLADGTPFAHAPQNMAGVIEARGIGLLKLPYTAKAPVRLAVDLDKIEPNRLPERRVITLLGVQIDALYKIDEPHFAFALKTMVLGGRYA